MSEFEKWFDQYKIKCPPCAGTGTVSVHAFSDATKFIDRTCRTCKGTGKIIKEVIPEEVWKAALKWVLKFAGHPCEQDRDYAALVYDIKQELKSLSQ